ncbi:DUF998 domain-containing protein [Micropruina sp.]|uniref:DUF998 domain-containing protein n=1 Tax=Micropruina sp. TaxID=2737536 RepID=UPI0039E3AD95
MTAAIAAITFALSVARLAMFIAVHFSRSGYNPVRHAVSDYAVGKTRALSSAMTWTSAGMWAALALAVGIGLPEWEDTTFVVVCLTVLALVFLVMPLLPTDLEGTPATRIGRLHLLAAILWFALSYACMGNFVRLMHQGFVGTLLSILSWVSLISLIALVAALVIRPLRSWAFGISERVFILSVSLFYTFVALQIVLW